MRKAELWALILLTTLTGLSVGYCAGNGVPRWMPGSFGGNARLPSTRAQAVIDSPIDNISPPIENTSDGLLSASEIARQRLTGFSKIVQNMEPDGNSPYNDLFFLPSYYSGRPGLCRATSFYIFPVAGVESQGRYLVIGSFEPPHSGNGLYERWEQQIRAACTAQIASSRWFTVDSDTPGSEGWDAYNGAQLIDGVVAAARAHGSLPFHLRCEPSDPSTKFCADARRSLAAIDPRELDRIAVRSFLLDKVRYVTTVIDMQGDPFVQLTVQQELPLHPGASGTVPNLPIVRDVDMRQEQQPIRD